MKFVIPNSGLRIHKLQLITVFNNKIVAIDNEDLNHIHQFCSKTWSSDCLDLSLKYDIYSRGYESIDGLAAFIYKKQLFILDLVQHKGYNLTPDHFFTRIVVYDLVVKTLKETSAHIPHPDGCSFVLYKDQILMFGGSAMFGSPTNNTFSMCLEPPYHVSTLICKGDFPPAVRGHCAVVYEDFMFVLPPKFPPGFSRRRAWKLDLKNNFWSELVNEFPFNVRGFVWAQRWNNSIIFLRRNGKVLEYNMENKTCYKYSGRVDSRYRTPCILNDKLMIFSRYQRNFVLKGSWFEMTLGEFTKLKPTKELSDVQFFFHI